LALLVAKLTVVGGYLVKHELTLTHVVLKNADIARTLRQIAELLSEQQANIFRTQAYQRAAKTLEQSPENVALTIEREGHTGLLKLPGIGEGLASVIEELVRSGHCTVLDRLRGEAEPELVLQTIPGIGPSLAKKIHHTLGVESLEELEVAAMEGRLESVPGVGPRRADSILFSIAGRLGRPAPRPRPSDQPSVTDLLAIDADYRNKVAKGTLHVIAPKRFNPQRIAWLPIMHKQRGDWHYTALFSNTARAHQLGCTHDWVVIYYYDSDHCEGQATIVTETFGTLAGQRVVRGREAETNIPIPDQAVGH
jgi:putative hydrolase